MRIGLVTTEFPPFYGGGIGTYCGSLTRALVQAGHDVHVLVPGSFTGTMDGVTIHPFDPPSPPDDTLPRALRQFGEGFERSYHLAARLRTFVRDTGVEIIESQEYLGLVYHALYERLWREDPLHVPIVVTLHGGTSDLLEADGLPKYGTVGYMQSFFEDCTVQWADAIVSPSRWYGHRTARRLGIPTDRVAVCPLPYQVRDYAPIDRTPSEVLFVGRMERRKGVEMLVRTLPAVFHAIPDCRVRFVGADWYDSARDASMRGWMENRLAAFGDRIIFEGLQPPERVREFMARAGLVVIPSTWENFPNVCLEAAAAAAPILASDSNGMAEILEEGRSGLFFENGSADALSARLIEMLTLDSRKRECLGRQARERVRSLCDPARVVEERVAHYREVIARASASALPSYPRHLLGRADRPTPRGESPSRLAVIIPCYNMGDTLMETLDSVRSSSRPPDELVVVDDGSTDPRTLDVLSRLGPDARVVRTENRGLSAARNVGVASTTSDTLLFLDADDLIDRRLIEIAWPILERHRDVGAVLPWTQTFGIGNEAFCPPVPHFPYLLHTNMATVVGLVRRAAFDDVGGYRSEMTYGYEDWQFWIAMLDAGWGALTIPQRLFHYRVRQYSMLQSLTKKAEAFLLGRIVSLTPRPFREYFEECRLLEAERTPPAETVIHRITHSGANEVSIYGAGSGGQFVLRRLRAGGIRVKQFVDRSERLWGTTIESLPVRSLSQAMEDGDATFVIGSLSFADEMQKTIEEAFAGRDTRPAIFKCQP
jgi:glycosyltransferase involved in cell wall biosynthesis